MSTPRPASYGSTPITPADPAPAFANLEASDKTIAWLRNFAAMCEAGDAIVGPTPKSLALRAQLARQSAAFQTSRPRP